MTLTEPAHLKLVELRDEEPEGNRLGVRIEILSDTGPETPRDAALEIKGRADAAPGTDVRTLEPLPIDLPTSRLYPVVGPKGVAAKAPSDRRPRSSGTMSTCCACGTRSVS